MSIISILVTIFTSTVVAYTTAKLSSYSKDVTGERKEWRDRVRDLTVEAARLMELDQTNRQRFQDIISEFQIRLNPDDEKDKEILKTLRAGMDTPTDIQKAKFLAQVSRLLKHDWERAKSESEVLGIFNKPNEGNIRFLKSTDYLA